MREGRVRQGQEVPPLRRALDDAKAERLWLTTLPEFSDMFFGAEKVKCSISLQALRKYHEEYQKHRAFKKSLATS